jgi:polygalacturonase
MKLRFINGISILLLLVRTSVAQAGENSIVNFGAVGDGKTLDTHCIQTAIDRLASKGGGTLVVPKGVFLSGAIFLKPGVNLYLDKGAVFKGSTNIADYPEMRTRIEGHFQVWVPALLNADKCNGLRITGSGTLDGDGWPFWKEFWARRKADPQITNLAVKRPRLAYIHDCKDVRISGITFKDSALWNLHLYRCQDVVVNDVRFEVPWGVKCPSTDGTDVDSCQNVTIEDCTYRVDDDCVCLKGSKGPFAMDDKTSPPVEHILVKGCTFERGQGVVTVGSEATIVRNVVVEDCKVFGSIPLVRLKLRPDTPQDYEDLHYRDITLDGTGAIIQVRPWMQFFNLKGQQPPESVVKNVTISDIKGSFGSFGVIRGNPGQTEISNITLTNINVHLKNPRLDAIHVKNLRIENVAVNGQPFSLKPAG